MQILPLSLSLMVCRMLKTCVCIHAFKEGDGASPKLDNNKTNYRKLWLPLQATTPTNETRERGWWVVLFIYLLTYLLIPPSYYTLFCFLFIALCWHETWEIWGDWVFWLLIWHCNKIQGFDKILYSIAFSTCREEKKEPQKEKAKRWVPLSFWLCCVLFPCSPSPISKSPEH